MKISQIIFLFAGLISVLAYVIFANSVQETQYPWLMTRAFGLIAIALLFVSVVIGELRRFGLSIFCKQHCTLGIMTFYFALLHLISAIFDKIIWGKNLSLLDYLGFNYSDKWMILMSLGAVAFYFIIFVSITSSSGATKLIGCNNRKRIHYLSYLSLIIVFAHSIFLGTDLNHGELRVIFYPLEIFIFSILMFLLVPRLFGIRCTERRELKLALVIILLASGLIAYTADQYRIHGEYISNQDKEVTDAFNELNDLGVMKDDIIRQTTDLENQISTLQNETNNLSQAIKTKR